MFCCLKNGYNRGYMGALETLLKEYGWGLALGIYFIPKIWIWFTDRFYPQRIKERELEAERKAKQLEADEAKRNEEIRAEREARATLLKAQIEREERVALQQLEFDKRTVIALEQMGLGITVGNERIAALIASHTQHATFQFGAHIEIKERLDDIQDMITQRERLDKLEKSLTDTQEKIRVQGGAT